MLTTQQATVASHNTINTTFAPDNTTACLAKSKSSFDSTAVPDRKAGIVAPSGNLL